MIRKTWQDLAGTDIGILVGDELKAHGLSDPLCAIVYNLTIDRPDQTVPATTAMAILSRAIYIAGYERGQADKGRAAVEALAPSDN